MTKTNKVSLLFELAKLQEDCAPIKLSIGSTTETNMVRHDTIVINDAPPVVINKLVELGYSLFATEKGIVVDKF